MKLKLSKQNQLKYQQQLIKTAKKIADRIINLKAEDPFADPNHVIDNAAIDTDVREQIGHETIEAEIETLTKQQQLIKLALTKIDKGSYGICERCKKLIVNNRLKLVPETRYCIDCEKKLVK